MGTTKSFEERFDALVRIALYAGIAALVAMFVTHRLWTRPADLAAWICYFLAASCGLALLVDARRRIALFVVMASCGVSLLAFEALLEKRRLLEDAAWLAEVAERTGNEGSRAGDHNVARLAADPGLRGIRCPILATHVADGSVMPLGGWPHQRTLLGNELGYDAIYVADRFGFNNPDDAYDRRSGRASVVILGDSFAQGVAVRPDANAAAALRRQGYDVLNLGCAGNGPLAELAAYREYGRRFAPEVVVWFYLESNDLADLARESRTPLRNYLQPGFTQNLIARSDQVARFLDRLEVTPYRPRWPPARVATLVNSRALVSAVTTSQRERVQGLRDVAARLHDDVTADGARLVVVYLPDPSMVAGQSRRDVCRYSAANCRNQVLEVFSGLSIPVLDFEAVLARLEDPLDVYAFRIGHAARGHYTEAGYALLGEAIADELLERGP